MGTIHSNQMRTCAAEQCSGCLSAARRPRQLHVRRNLAHSRPQRGQHLQQRRCRCRALQAARAQQQQQQQQQLQGSGVDFPPYSTVSRSERYDLRFFEAYTVVRMDYERRDEGYIGLGAYFDGANSEGMRLNESQPVVMRFCTQGSKSMELHVGSRRDGEALKAAPQPLDSRLSLEAAGGEILAVLRFEGSATREATEAAVGRLKAALAEDSLRLGDEEAEGSFRLAQYGPLNSLSTRLNEVMLHVVL